MTTTVSTTTTPPVVVDAAVDIPPPPVRPVEPEKKGDPRRSDFEPVHTLDKERWPTTPLFFDQLSGVTGVEFRKIYGWPERETCKSISFVDCEFLGDFSGNNFKQCTFTRCTFPSAIFTDVKFSEECIFRNCSFTYSSFIKCFFIGGSFSGNWASAQYFSLHETEISAIAFISGLSVKTSHIPAADKKKVAYQVRRGAGTKAKIARAIFNSVKSSSDEELIDEAYGQTARTEVHARVADAMIRRAWLTLYSRYFDMFFVCFSGEITKWKTSVTRPVCAGVIFMLYFFLIYFILGWGESSAGDCFQRAFDVTLVAGYDAHTPRGPAGVFAHMCNLIVGIYWYSLMTSVVFRRAVRG